MNAARRPVVPRDFGSDNRKRAPRERRWQQHARGIIKGVKHFGLPWIAHLKPALFVEIGVCNGSSNAATSAALEEILSDRS